PNRSSPARPDGQVPPRDEGLDQEGTAVVDMHPHNFGARWYRAIPGAVIRHERITGVVRRKPGARVEREPEGRRMRLYGQRRGLDAGAVGPGELGVGLVRKIALRPTVPRSEERRVGKEWRARGARYHEKKKEERRAGE